MCKPSCRDPTIETVGLYVRKGSGVSCIPRVTGCPTKRHQELRGTALVKVFLPLYPFPTNSGITTSLHIHIARFLFCIQIYKEHFSALFQRRTHAMGVEQIICCRSKLCQRASGKLSHGDPSTWKTSQSREQNPPPKTIIMEGSMKSYWGLPTLPTISSSTVVQQPTHCAELPIRL